MVSSIGLMIDLSFIYTTIEDQFIVLHIEDNGIGIDLKKRTV
jgi:signal transduction histidine kinase